MNEKRPEVAFIGFGGCGLNSLNYFQGAFDENILFAQVEEGHMLDRSQADIKIRHDECSDGKKIRSLFPDLRLFILVGGLGGSSCGYMPEIARILKSGGAAGVALLTQPFAFENRQKEADMSMAAIRKELQICAFPNSAFSKDPGDGAALAEFMLRQAEGMRLCAAALINGRGNAGTFSLSDLSRLFSRQGA